MGRHGRKNARGKSAADRNVRVPTGRQTARATPASALPRFALVAVIIAVVAGWMLWPETVEPIARGTQTSITDPNDLTGWQAGLTAVRASTPTDAESDADAESEFVTDGAFDDYIGTESCIECHRDQHHSYQLTSHSRSFRDCDVSLDPAGGSFAHDPSSYDYTVYRDGDQLRHRGVLVGASGEKIAATDLPMRYTVGSGAHAHSFLYQSDGIFYQSPLTWYREYGGWKMSPGFEGADQVSFNRSVGEGCVFCHVGRIERSADNQANFRIVEQTIGCERCHGPGKDHVQLHRGTPGTDASDLVDSIVHPGKLSRDQSEAICQQCHLQGVAGATAPGKSAWDFRPGQSTLDVRSDYQVSGKSEFKIVAHVEQMHQSACYMGSETLTCITCHDPHHNAPVENSVQYYREACFGCHSDASCGVRRDERVATNQNDCAACHMPKRPTNVSHAALHHHRIGIHDLSADASESDSGDDSAGTKLLTILNSAKLDPSERTRREFIALNMVLQSPGSDPGLQEQLEKAAEQISESASTSATDELTRMTYAKLLISRGDAAEAFQIAREVQATAPRGSVASVGAQSMLATLALSSGRPDVALSIYRSLTRVMASPNDLYYLAKCEFEAGNVRGAVEALEKAAMMNPGDASIHQALVEIFDVIDPSRAAQHRRVVKSLEELDAVRTAEKDQ